MSPYTSSPNNGYSGQAQSPNYSPNQNSVVNSPFTPSGENAKGPNRVYSPSYLSSSKVGGHSIMSSPSGTGPASPNYSPQQSHDFYGSHRSQNSPAYSPTNAGGASNSSPHYSPTHYNYSVMSGYQPNAVKSNYSPSYSPTTPGFISASPKYNTNRSPRYQVKSSHEDDLPGSGGLAHMYIP